MGAQTMTIIRPWGCRNGHTTSLVKDTAHDEEGYVIRHRQCTTCDAFWTTQELPIDPDSYWTRAHSRNVARMAIERKKKRACTKCGVVYGFGMYRTHIKSRAHDEALMPMPDRNRGERRTYGREWARRTRAIPWVRPRPERE